MRKLILSLSVFALTLIFSVLFLSSGTKATDPYTCDNPAFEYSTYSAACVPKECPPGTHYSYTGTLCLCDDESLQACTDPETGITSKCIPKNEICIVESDDSEDGDSEDDGENIPIVNIAHVSKITGDDVTYQKGGKGEDLPLTEDTILEEGDVINTGFDSAVLLRFGDFTQVMIHQTSSIRFDESFSEENIERTRMYLNVGAVSARVRHTPSIRSDFSVSTAGMSSASIRNSAMSVTFDDTYYGDTVVYVTEDKAYITQEEGDEEFEVTEGDKIQINDLGDQEKTAYTLDEIPPMELEYDEWTGVFDTVEADDNTETVIIIAAVCGSLFCLILVAGVSIFLLTRRRSNKA